MDRGQRKLLADLVEKLCALEMVVMRLENLREQEVVRLENEAELATEEK